MKQSVIETLGSLIHNDLVPALENTESVPGLKVTQIPNDIDPTKFNRIEFLVGQRPFTLSLFQSAPAELQPDGRDPYDMTLEERFEAGIALPGDRAEDLYKPPVEEAAEFTPALTFTSDFRVSNPKLHQLYVGWARETIQLTTRMCRELWDQSRWPASSIASAAWTELVAHMKTDAAWFEAAALEFMHPQGENVSGPQIFVGDSLRNIPPGEYEGFIAERNGKLYFELTEDMMVKGD